MGAPNTFGLHSSVPNACLVAVRISKANMASKASKHATVQHTMQGRSRSGTTMRTRLLEAHVAKLVATRMRHWLHAKLAAKTPLAGRLGRLPMATLSQCPLCSLHALPNDNGPLLSPAEPNGGIARTRFVCFLNDSRVRRVCSRCALGSALEYLHVPVVRVRVCLVFVHIMCACVCVCVCARVCASLAPSGAL